MWLYNNGSGSYRLFIILIARKPEGSNLWNDQLSRFYILTRMQMIKACSGGISKPVGTYLVLHQYYNHTYKV